MGKIIAITNQKGGVGKTTTSINVAACLADQGKKVLLVDMDPQGNATSGVGIIRNELENTVYELLLGECESSECKAECAVENLDVLPSNANLSGAEIDLIGMENREFILKDALDQVKDDYDFVIIDCPPALNLLTVNALVAADITINKNMVPFDTRSAFQTSGFRLGTPAITTRGAKEDLMIKIAAWIEEVLNDPENENVIAKVRGEVNAEMKNYPLFAW